MTVPSKIIAAVVGSVLAIIVLVMVSRSMYFTPKAALQSQITNSRRFLADANRESTAHLRVDESIQSFADKTLGSDREAIDHALRSALNRLGSAVELEQLSVATHRTRTHESPRRRDKMFRRDKTLRDRVDFVELEATLAGRGTLEQAVELMCRLEAEPWLKRIDRLSLDPQKNPKQLAISLSLTSLYIPGRKASAPLQPGGDGADRVAHFTSLIERRPFEKPRKKPPPKDEPEPTGPPPFPFEQWIVTGVARGPQGPEVWLRHAESGETRLLAVGQAIDTIAFAASVSGGEQAEFTEDGARFGVRVGSNLAERVASPM